MSLFVEVESIVKSCTVIINLDKIVEIAPLKDGGCELFLDDYVGGTSSKASIRVKNDYSEFKQFAMQTVTAEDIARKIAHIGIDTVSTPVSVTSDTTDEEDGPRGRGRPKKII